MDVAMATGLNHMRSKPLALQFACVPLLAASGELEMVCGRTDARTADPSASHDSEVDPNLPAGPVWMARTKKSPFEWIWSLHKALQLCIRLD